MWPVRTLALALALVSAACADDTATPTSGSTGGSTGEASTAGPTATSVTPPTTTTTTGGSTEGPSGTSGTSGGGSGLCERLGPGGPQKLAIGTAAALLSDERVNAYFLNAEVDGGRFIDCLIDQIAVWADCPGATYGCTEMQAAHAGRGISAVDFADFVDDVGLALAELRATTAPELSDADAAALLGEFAALAGEIVEDPGDAATLYQRVGRKPGLQAIVGAPAQAGSWLARVTGDAALSGFFAGADDVRLGTCLVRQLAALDGPAVYGGEVDAPQGVDPGVGAKEPCAAMGPAHAGVTNAMMGGAPITAADFVAMLGHLGAAATAAGVGDADAAALQASLEPLCPEIVVDDGQCPAFAEEELYEATGLAALIEDGLYDGTKGTMRCHAFEVPADGIDVVAGLRVEVGVDSGHAGDLTIKVVAPDMTTVTLVSRPGLAEAADDGEGCGGDSSNLAGGSVLVFETGGAKDAELMGDGLDTSGVVCQDDMACSYAPNKGAAGGGDLTGFVGVAAPGSWSVCVGDSCGGFVAKLQTARLHLAQAKL